MKKKLRELWQILTSYLPNLGEIHQKGYRAHMSNGDFILSKETPAVRISLHQSVEPFNPAFGKYIDFENPECSMVVLTIRSLGRDQTETLIRQLRQIFEFVYYRGDRYIFCFNKEMDLHGREMAANLDRLEALLP